MIPNTSRRTTAAERALLAAVAIALAVSALGFAVGPVAAGDGSAIIMPAEQTVEADPGEAVTVDVLMQSDGGHGGEGVESVALVAQYNPDYLELTDVERGPWLEQGTETDIHSERALAHDQGTAVLEQWRDPVADGATGSTRLATITVAVADDAPPSEASISFAESDVYLVREFPMTTHELDLTVSIDGGGERAPPFDHPDPDSLETTDVDDERAENETDGASGDEPTAETSNDVDGDDADADAVPSVSVSITVGSIVGTALAYSRLRRSDSAGT